MRSLAVSFAVAAFTGVASVLAAPALPSFTKSSISSWTFSGNGCPQGTNVTLVDIHTKGSVTWLEFNVPSFNVSIGGSSTVYDHTKNCEFQISLDLGSVTVSTYGTEVLGNAYLESGVTATLFSAFFASADAADTVTTQSTISGGGSYAASSGAAFLKTLLVPSGSQVSSSCGGSTTDIADVRVALTSSDSSASGEVDLKGEYGNDWSIAVGLAWASC